MRWNSIRISSSRSFSISSAHNGIEPIGYCPSALRTPERDRTPKTRGLSKIP